jgi:hypothetical protein
VPSTKAAAIRPTAKVMPNKTRLLEGEFSAITAPLCFADEYCYSNQNKAV